MLPGLTGIKSGASPAPQRGRPQRGAAHGDHAIPNFTPCTPGRDPTPEGLRPWGTAPILPVPAVPTSHPPSPPSPPPPRGTVGMVTDGLVGLQLEGRKEKRSQPEERAIQIVFARLPWPLEPRGLSWDHPGGGWATCPHLGTCCCVSWQPAGTWGHRCFCDPLAWDIPWHDPGGTTFVTSLAPGVPF